jgi:hypothetical protein
MSGLLGKTKKISTTETAVGALKITNSSQGLPIPLVFGTTRLAPNMVDYFNFQAVPHTETRKSGGKGGGGVETSNTSYTYTVGLILAMMEGPSAAGDDFIGTAWAGKDVTSAANLGLTTYAGTYNQSAWPYMTSCFPAQAETYRGTAYAAHSALDLGSNPSLPNLGFEVTGLVGAGDVNVANVIAPFLTDEHFGAGWPAAQLGSLTELHDYCAAANLAVAPAYTTQRPAADTLQELVRIANSAIVWSENLLKFRPYADEPVGSYTPDMTVQYALTFDDFISEPGDAPVRVSRGRAADAYNSVAVNVRDRGSQYNTASVPFTDQWQADTYGVRRMDPVDLPAICDLGVGLRVAQNLVRRSLYVRNTYEFTLSWKYARLEPMDIVSLTDATQGLDAVPVRIVSIEEDEDGRLRMTAEDVATGSATAGSYATASSNGSTPAAGTPPGDTYTPPVIFQPPLALAGRPQVWVGAQGGEDWGGAQVWVSIDGGTSYSMAGQVLSPARYGTLTANLPQAADPDSTSTLAVSLTVSRGELAAGTSEDADAGQTLAYVSGPDEILAFSAATLTSANNYSLNTYLRRGQAGTVPAAHSIGASFLRLDDAVAKIDVSPSLYGTTLYIKFLSYNRQGGALQSLADVSPITYTLAAQVPTGSGFAFKADRSTTTVGDPGPGYMRLNNAAQGSATKLVFDEVTSDGANLAAYFTSVGNSGFVDLRDYYDSNRWATYKITGANAPAGYQTFDVVFQTGGRELTNNAPLLASFSPLTATGNVTASSSNLRINSQTANYTLASADFNVATLIEMNSAANIVLTVPSDANLTTANGANVLFARGGAGTVTIAAQANVSILVAGSATLRATESVGSLAKMGPNRWRLFGDLS